MSYNVQVSIKEIYQVLCPKCKKRLIRLIKDKIDEKLILQALGVEEKGEAR